MGKKSNRKPGNRNVEAGNGGEPTASVVEAPLGGVMTREVGTITGPIHIVTQNRDGKTFVTAGYEGADEDDYKVEGSPLTGDVPHDEVVAHLTRDAGVDEYDNPRYTTLEDYPRK